MMNPAIREACMEDSEAISRLMSQLLHKEITEEVVRNRLEFVSRSPFDSMYVYEDQAILGVLGFRIREHLEDLSRYGEISVVVVDEDAKRTGIGRSLMALAEELAVQHECKGTWLVSGFKRINEAHKFYKQLGYEETGVRFVKNF